MKTCFKSIVFLEALTLILLLQGCVNESTGGDHVFRRRSGGPIAAGAEEAVFQVRFPGSACARDGIFLTTGQIFQGQSVPSVVNLIARKLDPNDVILQEMVFAIQVNGDGSIPPQTFPYSIDGGCFNPGEQLSLSARPEGGMIAPDAAVIFQWAQVATTK